VVVADEPADTVEAFYNGVSQGSQSFPTAWTAAVGGFALGHDGAGGGFGWDGRLQEFAIYESALSAATILAHYNRGAS
jgi:hypothetical protein